MQSLILTTMKTNIKSLTTGILATMVFVALCATAQATTSPITGWGVESDQANGPALVETPTIGSFTIAGPITGNYEMRALLPTTYSLASVGDTITFSGNWTFPSGNCANQAWRIAILNTNNGNGTVGTLSGGVWSHPNNPTNYLGYIMDVAAGANPVLAGRSKAGTTHDWDTTSYDFYNLNGVLTNAPNLTQGTFYFSISVQKVANGFLNVYYSVTNSSGSYSNYANVGDMYDDGALVAGQLGPSTTNFNAVGLFQNGSDGGGTGPFIYTNLTVTFANNPNTGWTNVVIDTFKPAGIAANRYDNGKIIYVWTNWFGGAWVTNIWNSSIDAGGDNTPGSGCLQISNNWANGTQFFVWDQNEVSAVYGGPIPGLNMADFSCDVQFDPSSAWTVAGGTNIFGHLQIGTITNNAGARGFMAFPALVTGYDIVTNNTGWVHINVPMSANLNTFETAISNIVFKIDGGWYSPSLAAGTTTLRVDNVSFIENTNLVGIIVSNPVPVLTISPAIPGMRIFAKNSASYIRDEVGTVNQSVGWFGAYPTSYSFTLTNMPPLSASMQENIFLIPVNTLPYAAYNNAYADYDATNCFGLNINATGSNYAATVSYKVNDPSAAIPIGGNATPSLGYILVTNYGSSIATGQATGNGTWTLTFTSATAGWVQGPGLSQQAFTIPPGVSAQFANPVVAYFGIQPNSGSGVGQYVDFLNITITNSGSVVINDNFASGMGNWTVAGSDAGGIWDVTPDSAYWINWTSWLTSAQGDIEVSTNLLAPASAWINPAFYYGDYNSPPSPPGTLIETLEGTKLMWTLISTNDWPLGAKQAFFQMSSSPNY